MRLTCPNCAATYDLPDDRVPGGGSHVQCSACHTRWFARPAAAPERLSEDEIITRLETRQARPRLAAEGPSPRTLEGIQALRPEPNAPEPQPERKAPALRAAESFQPRGTEAASDLWTTGEAPPPRTQTPAPILFPTAERPAPSVEGNREGPPPPPPTPLRPRQGERFETLAPARATRTAPEPVRPPARRRGHFALGLLLALLLAGAGLGAYLRPGEVTARAPAAAPMLDGYAARVDAARDWIETRLGPLRDRLTAR